MSVPSRTTAALVQGVLLRDYDADRSPDLTGFIAAASAMVDRAAFDAANNKGITLTPIELELIERWLAAHMYAQSDKTFRSKSTEGASGAYDGATAQGLESTNYGQMAMRLDYSQCLRNIDKQQIVGGFWLGTPPEDAVVS